MDARHCRRHSWPPEVPKTEFDENSSYELDNYNNSSSNNSNSNNVRKFSYMVAMSKNDQLVTSADPGFLIENEGVEEKFDKVATSKNSMKRAGTPDCNNVLEDAGSSGAHNSVVSARSNKSTRSQQVVCDLLT